MIRNPILTCFDLLSRLWRREQRNLRSAFLRPDKLPQFVQDCPSAMRILDLLGPIAWDQFPERNLERFWGQTTIPHVAFSAACLIKLNENLVSIGDLHRYLIEHPAFIWFLGFPLVPSPKHLCGFDPVASLPTLRHLTQMLRDISNDALQFILEQSVVLLMAEFSALGLSVGDCISLDTKHIIAWVKENNPKAYAASVSINTNSLLEILTANSAASASTIEELLHSHPKHPQIILFPQTQLQWDNIIGDMVQESRLLKFLSGASLFWQRKLKLLTSQMSHTSCP
jgi:hypothetical protein